MSTRSEPLPTVPAQRTCTGCGIVFRSSVSIRERRHLPHPLNRPLLCTVCGTLDVDTGKAVRRANEEDIASMDSTQRRRMAIAVRMFRSAGRRLGHLTTKERLEMLHYEYELAGVGYE